MKKYFLLSLYISSVSFVACSKNPEGNNTPLPVYDSIPTVAAVKPIINEASGIADSKAQPGHLWVQEDSGNPTQLFLLKHDGTVVKKVFLKGIVNRDWEELALVNNTMYLAEIGDNNEVYPEYAFYTFTEPASGTDTVTNITAIRFKYADGSHDAEAFLVDPQTKDIFLITKRDNPSRIYKISYPYAGGINTATLTDSLTYSWVVGAALAPDGNSILIKTYTRLYQYPRKNGEPLNKALQNAYVQLPYVMEPQGEAVTFANDHSGFFTLSEKGLFGNVVNLYFYKKK